MVALATIEEGAGATEFKPWVDVACAVAVAVMVTASAGAVGALRMTVAVPVDVPRSSSDDTVVLGCHVAARSIRMAYPRSLSIGNAFTGMPGTCPSQPPAAQRWISLVAPDTDAALLIACATPEAVPVVRGRPTRFHPLVKVMVGG